MMFEEKILKYIQRARVCLRFIRILDLSEHKRQPDLLHIFPWQNPTSFPSSLSLLCLFKSKAPSILSPRLPASAFCALFSDLKIEVSSYIQEGIKKPPPQTHTYGAVIFEKFHSRPSTNMGNKARPCSRRPAPGPFMQQSHCLVITRIAGPATL